MLFLHVQTCDRLEVCVCVCAFPHFPQIYFISLLFSIRFSHSFIHSSASLDMLLVAPHPRLHYEFARARAMAKAMTMGISIALLFAKHT